MRYMLGQSQPASTITLPAPTEGLLRNGSAWWRQTSRPRRILILLAAVWILNGFDLGFTILAQLQGTLTELNPVARHLLPYGAVALLLYKLVALGIGTAVLWRCRHHASAEIGTWVALAVYVGVSLRWHVFYDAMNAMHTQSLLVLP